jgi:hypothetical protein
MKNVHIRKYQRGDLVTLGRKVWGWAGGPHDLGVIIRLRPESSSRIPPHYYVFLSGSQVVKCIPWDYLEVVK